MNFTHLAKLVKVNGDFSSSYRWVKSSAKKDDGSTRYDGW